MALALAQRQGHFSRMDTRMTRIDSPARPSPAQAALDPFFARVAGRSEQAFADATAELARLDVRAIAARRLDEIAAQWLDGARDVANELGPHLPHLGHLLLRSEADVALSISVRKPAAAVPAVLSTSGRHEYHRVLAGRVEIHELVVDDTDGTRFRVCAPRVLEAGDELLRFAGRGAFTLRPLTACTVVSASGWQTARFHTNVDRASGRVVGQSFSESHDSILCNVLELCARAPDAALAPEIRALFGHPNHRVRLAAFKAAACAGALDPAQLRVHCAQDMHPAIRALGNRLAEVAA